MSWPVFVTLPDGARFAVEQIAYYQWDTKYGMLQIAFAGDPSNYYGANITAAEMDELIAGAQVAATQRAAEIDEAARLQLRRMVGVV